MARSARLRWRNKSTKSEQLRSLMCNRLLLMPFTRKKWRNWLTKFGLPMTRTTPASFQRLRWNLLLLLIWHRSARRIDFPRSSSMPCSPKLMTTTMVKLARLKWRSSLKRSEPLRLLIFKKLLLRSFIKRRWRSSSMRSGLNMMLTNLDCSLRLKWRLL